MDKKKVKKLKDLNKELRDYNWVVCATEEDAMKTNPTPTGIYHIEDGNIYIARLDNGLYQRVLNKINNNDNSTNVQR